MGIRDWTWLALAALAVFVVGVVVWLLLMRLWRGDGPPTPPP